jgi:ferredoxin-NADP reductase
LVSRTSETASAQTLVFDVPGWPSHLPGQHVDVRLTAPDGYQAARSYSLAAPHSGDQLELTVQKTPGGEVSPFLTDALQVGDVVEVRGPVGGWFAWNPERDGSALLIGGGSGVVPLMSMVRARPPQHPSRFRLLCSVRGPDDRLYAQELDERMQRSDGLEVTWIYTRKAPAQSARPPGRLSADDIKDALTIEPGVRCYVCGPTGFVESVATLLLDTGHDAAQIRTERFGGV